MSVKLRWCVLSVVFLVLGTGVSAAQTGVATQQDGDTWKQFVSMLRAGPIPAEKVRPYEGVSKDLLIGFLSTIREKAIWSEWEATPEIHRVGSDTHYVIPLTIDGTKQTLSFTFLNEGGNWYFHHIESILLRLDEIGTLPVTAFPDLPESQKAWMREEIAATEQMKLFNVLATEKGKQAAFDWFRDGRGYFLAARTWVPLAAPSRAFILYLCWEQANLRGNSVTLEKLDDSEAVVRISPIYLKLYEQTANFKERISADDYRKIFDTIWQDRAAAAGWNLQQTCTGPACVFHFSKAAE
ncbi:MAG: hypothetical protein ABSG84_05665 [Acidobacteriaceae bacterium]|jgi:hypothetical protein